MILEYKIDGMTCVACSRTIENAMTAEFQYKGMISVQIALLTHKMRIVFDQDEFKKHNITAELVKDEVEMVGFSAELLEMIENNQEELLNKEYMSSLHS
jgi:cation transport ATPase